MKAIAYFIVVAAALFVSGCGAGQPLPDSSTAKQIVPPGTKTQDVVLQIHK
jgi:hypothetical protein